MTKKEYFEKFFANSGWAFLGWCIFNIIFAIAYFVVGVLQEPIEIPTGPDFHECLIPYVIIYIVALVPAFLMGFFWMNKTGNAISDFVSLLPIRFLTVVSSLWIAGYHYYYKFANFSVLTFDTMMNMVNEYRLYAYNDWDYKYFDTDPIFYYLTSIIPFVIMFIGFQFGKRRRKNKQEKIKE